MGLKSAVSPSPEGPQPGLRIYYGQTVIDVSNPANATIAGYRGHVTDICALLAA